MLACDMKLNVLNRACAHDFGTSPIHLSHVYCSLDSVYSCDHLFVSGCEVTQIPVNKSFFDSDELYWLLGVAIVMAFIVSLVVCQHRFRRIKYKRYGTR